MINASIYNLIISSQSNLESYLDEHTTEFPNVTRKVMSLSEKGKLNLYKPDSGQVQTVGTKVLATFDNLVDLLQHYKGCVSIIGCGDTNPFSSKDELISQVDNVVQELNEKYDKGSWVVIFGGDLLQENKLTVANIASHLKNKHGVPVVAITNNFALPTKENPLRIDNHVDAVFIYETVYNNPDNANDSKSNERTVVWGGVDKDGKPLATTALRFKKEINVTDVFAFGGGQITLSEYIIAQKLQLDPHFIKCSTVDRTGGRLAEFLREKKKEM